jgi:hypothetical protein
VNPGHAASLLAAVKKIAPDLVAFFGSMYYAALRPEEALHLREDEYERPTKVGSWGWLHLTGATIAVGTGWGDGETAIEDRQLKHRAKTATRDVPVAPALVKLLDRHVSVGRPAADRGGPERRPGGCRPCVHRRSGDAGHGPDLRNADTYATRPVSRSGLDGTE